MPATVVITRPQAQAEGLARRVEALGRTAVVFPLLEIHPLTDTRQLQASLAQLQDYALVAFVSPNAIDAAFEHLKSWPAAVPIAVMGEGSRQALARHGVSEDSNTIVRPRDPARTDSETLLQALDLAALRGKRVLIIRGESGRELLADALREAGAEVSQVAAYRRVAPLLDPVRAEHLSRLLAQPHLWVVTSSEGLRVLLAMVRQLNLGDPVATLQAQTLLVPHVRIAETAKAMGLNNIILTGSGDEQLLAALQSAP